MGYGPKWWVCIGGSRKTWGMNQTDEFALGVLEKKMGYGPKWYELALEVHWNGFTINKWKCYVLWSVKFIWCIL